MRVARGGELRCPIYLHTLVLSRTLSARCADYRLFPFPGPASTYIQNLHTHTRTTYIQNINTHTRTHKIRATYIHSEPSRCANYRAGPSPENPVSASPALVGYNTPSDIIRTALVREPSSRTARCAACLAVESAASMPATRAACRTPAAPRTPAALAQPGLEELHTSEHARAVRRECLSAEH